MLINTFIHMPGIGAATEKKIWQANILDWKNEKSFALSALPPAKQKTVRQFAEESREHLEKKNPAYFEHLLPSNQHFRLFPEFRESCAYLDIETTGLDASSSITTIAVYDGRDIRWFVQGQNLHEFPDAIKDYKVLITYNGRCFDIPFIEAYFNVRLHHSQIDLRYILNALGYKGGLKKCEKSLGIDREELDGVDGYFAVLLWRDYMRSRNKKALETLLAYNIEDVINLEPLMIKAYNLSIERTVFAQSHQIEQPSKPVNPMKADIHTIERLKRFYY